MSGETQGGGLDFVLPDATPAAATMLGRDPASLIGRSLADLPGIGPAVAGRLGEIAEAGDLELGTRVIERCAGPIQVDLSGRLRRDPDGALIELGLRAHG